MSVKACLTNLYSKIIYAGGEQFSTVVIESTAAVPMELNYPRQDLCRVTTKADLIMYPGPLLVEDGIIKNVLVEYGPGQVILEINLEEEVQGEIIVAKGFPHRVIVRFSRRLLRDFYSNKEIIIDPGHGGQDGGWRGPVDLWEKDMVWETALEMKQIFADLGAQVVLTRTKEENPSWRQRISQVSANTFCFISVHYHGQADADCRGAAVLYSHCLPGNKQLAGTVLEKILSKTKSPGRGIKARAELGRLGSIWALRIEPAVITNWVDEGLLRNPNFHFKTALAIAVGIKEHFKAGNSCEKTAT